MCCIISSRASENFEQRGVHPAASGGRGVGFYGFLVKLRPAALPQLILLCRCCYQQTGLSLPSENLVCFSMV
jgi:hypothetical protein